MRMKVKRIASGLYGEDSSEFAIFNSEHLRERPPSGTKEYGVELAVVLKEDSQAFWDGKDGVAMGDIFNDRTVNMLSKFHCSLGSTRGAHPPAFARKRDKERVFDSRLHALQFRESEDAAVATSVA